VRVLITNDDGVDSPGIQALAAVAVDLGLDVVVAAPGWDSSGASASLTAVERDGRLLLEERSFQETPGLIVYAVEAAPAFIVRAASTGAFGPPPDIVASGINHGPNTGHAVLHSGTVGAALTASTFGMPAAAFSIGTGTPTHWPTAAAVARVVLEWLIDADERIVLNVNIPNVSLGDLQGVERARLAAFGAVQATVTESGAGYVKLAYTDVDAELEPGTDAAALAARVACYTPVRAACETDGDDVAALEQLFEQWRRESARAFAPGAQQEGRR
jgi:5'-nucleotidase